MKKAFFVICGILILTPMAYAKLSASKFPGTINEISFKSRVENLTDGYKPFLDKKAYQELNIVPGEEIYTDRMIDEMKEENEQEAQDAQTMNIFEYCAKHPNDTEKCFKTESPENPKSDDTKPQQTPTPPTSTTTSHQTQHQNNTNYTGYTIGGGQVIENNIVTGGSCYPADHDKNFVNKVLTTGRYEKNYPALEKGLITLFRKEGRCGTIKNDRCGYTCYGIGSSSKCAGIVVNSRAEAEDVYYERYWKKYKIDKLPDVISTDIFLAGVGSGPTTALQQFREFLGLPKSSKPVDDEMIRAVNNYSGDIHNNWINKRYEFLQRVAKIGYDGKVSNGYKNAIEIKRKNGCHVRPEKPLYRQ